MCGPYAVLLDIEAFTDHEHYAAMHYSKLLRLDVGADTVTVSHVLTLSLALVPACQVCATSQCLIAVRILSSRIDLSASPAPPLVQ